MEEADALANRVGILARKMLAIGTPANLRRQFGDAYHVHLITRKAAETPPEEMDRIRAWVVEWFPNAQIEARSYYGQLKFSVPTSQKHEDVISLPTTMADDDDRDKITPCVTSCRFSSARSANGGGIGAVFRLLEAHKDELGLEYYSVSPTTLDEVFLAIVGRHNVQEENYQEQKKKKHWLF
jgi:ATP-binding cassette, subfamily A (ABC1), member 3